MALEKATITNLLTRDEIRVMFNPEEYSFDLANNFAEIAIPGLRTPPIQYVRGNIRTLKMDLFFDTYEERTDVRGETRKLTALLEKDRRTQAPPVLLFAWGGLNFKCVLESVGQQFIMFLEDGTPVRARLAVSFKEYAEVEITVEQGFFVGPATVHNILAGEDLTKISGDLLGDPGAWREIAQLNDIDNPRKLTPGIELLIPPRRPKVR